MNKRIRTKNQELEEYAEKRSEKLITRYVDCRTKVLIKCVKGHEFSVTPTHYKRGGGCPKCAGTCPEQARDDLFKEALGRGHSVIGEYVNSKTKILIKCENGHEFMAIPSNYKNGSGCPKCSGTCPDQARDNFLKEVLKKGHSVIGDYVDTKTKILIKCEHGHEFKMTPTNYKTGYGCPKCAGTCPEQARDSFYKEALKRGHSITGKYVNTTTKILIKCEHGHEFSMAPHSYKHGQGCPKCAGSCPEQARDNFYKEALKRGQSVIGEYVNTETKVLIKCEEGHEFSVTPDHYKRGRGCPKCAGQCPEQARDNFYKEVERRGDKVKESYLDATKKILIECQHGHEFSTIPNNYKRGSGCPKCAGTCLDQAREDFYEEALKRGHSVIGEYVNNETKILIKCEEGHEFNVRPGTFKRGSGCPKCAGQCPEQARDNFYKEVERNGDKAKEKYIDATTKILIECQHGHEFSMTPNNYKNGKGCRECANITHDFNTLYGHKEHYNSKRMLYKITFQAKDFSFHKVGLATAKMGIEGRYPQDISKYNLKMSETSFVVLDNYTATLVEAYIKFKLFSNHSA